jgi:hypothetical protein
VKVPAAKPASGYSGTPLARKLGILAATQVLTRQAPANYREWLEPLPQGVIFARRLSSAVDVIHLFVTRKIVLQRDLGGLRKAIRADAAVWVSWPKKASKLPTDVTEDTIREVALPLGFVDIKVCAVTEVWSGLKLVIRRELRR